MSGSTVITVDNSLTLDSILEELRSSPVIQPHWLKILDSVRYSSLSRSKIYELIDQGAVKSVCLREKDKLKGVRLIFRPSLDSYLAKFENIKSEPVPGRKGRKSKAEKESEVL
jgi:hypothetical protein